MTQLHDKSFDPITFHQVNNIKFYNNSDNLYLYGLCLLSHSPPSTVATTSANKYLVTNIIELNGH